MAGHKSQFTLKDFSDENSTTEVYNGPITALTIAAFLTQFGDLRDAIDAITLGTMHKEQWIGDTTVLSNDIPTNAFAQRELKWLVSYKGNTTNKKFTFEIPTADPEDRLVPGTDLADLTNTEIAAFVTAFETIGKTPDSDTEGVTVLKMTLVGRNL